MKLQKLWVEDFKNLKNFSIDFNKEKSITVVIGWNGTGKSNVLEALVIIFRDLDLGKPTQFAYEIKYTYHNNLVEIDNHPKEKGQSRLVVKINSKKPKTIKAIDYLPAYVFGYYSGPSNRLKEHFLPHQIRYYDKIIKAKASDTDSIKDLKALRHLFCAQDHHSKYVLLSFFFKKDKKISDFLVNYLRIVGLESVLFVLKKPSWGKNKHLWGAKGLVRSFMDKLFDISLAPMKLKQRLPTTLKRSKTEELYYLYIKNLDSLEDLAAGYDSQSDFFASLESTDLSEVIQDVRIRVKIRNWDGSLTFRELSEGEQQLLMVLGLLKFTKEKESLVLLDEPDTHLNPFWSAEYLDLLEKIVSDDDDHEKDLQDTRHLIMTTHDPLVIAGLEKEQIRILKRDEKLDVIYSETPEAHPKGLSYGGILTSDMFGF